MTLPRWLSVAALYALQNSMMLTPCWPSAGPTGGAGLACPAWICSLISPTAFFFGAMLVVFPLSFPAICVRLRAPSAPRRTQVALDLGDLGEGQFDRCFATEDGHQHLEFLLLGVDLADRGRQRRERAVHDGDRLAHLEVHQDLRAFQRGFRRSSGCGRRRLARLLRRALREQELD